MPSEVSDPAELERECLAGLWRKIPAQAGEVLVHDVSLSKMKVNDLEPGALDGQYVAVLSADDPMPVDIFLVFDVASAIAFSGLLVMMQEKVIRDRMQSRKMDEDDLDAMGECVNQLTSSINEVLREALGSDWHVRFSSGGVEVPDKLEPHLAGRVVDAAGKLQVGKLHEGSFRLVIPEQVFTGRPPGEETASGVELSPEELEALRRAALEGLEDLGDVVLLLPLDRHREEWNALLDETGLGFQVVRTVHEARKVFEQGEASMVIVDADASPSGGLPALARLLSWSEVSAPVLVCASKPTRKHLVSCLASGASSYMVKPMVPDLLRDRIREIAAGWGDDAALGA